MSAVAPTPFTADEIRSGCPPGRVTVVRMGEPPALWRTTFAECDATGTVLEHVQVDTAGVPVGDTTRSASTWEQLRSHAEFPAESTTIRRERIATSLGDLDCLRYEVETVDGRRILWFSEDMPGLPVRTAAMVDGSESVESEVIADSTAPKA